MADTVFTHGPGNVTTLLTTTLEKRRKGKGIQDAVFNEMVLLAWLHEKNRTTEDGGATIVVPIMSGSNSTADFYDGYDTIDTTPQEGHTTAQYTWKQAAASISVSGREERVQNQGSSAVFRIVNAKMRQAELSLRDKINKAFFAASPVSTDVGSLVTTIDATSTIGDINSSSNSFWQGLVTTGGSFASQGLADMRTTYNTLSARSPGGPIQLILTEDTTHSRYEGSLQPQQRFSGSVGNGAFESLKFKNADVVYDVAATSGVMYFLHSDVLEFVVSSSTDFITTEFVKPSNQDARVAQILLAAELTASNRRKLGKITSITD